MRNRWVLVDVINHFEFPDGARLLKNALPIAPKLARLKERARRARIPAIYVNDNFGQWRSNASELLEYCLRPEAPGRQFVAGVRPDEEDYLVLKPMHSAVCAIGLLRSPQPPGTSTGD